MTTICGEIRMGRSGRKYICMRDVYLHYGPHDWQPKELNVVEDNLRVALRFEGIKASKSRRFLETVRPSN